MAGGESYYDLEDLYQAFKERILKELRDDLSNLKKGRLTWELVTQPYLLSH
jgi:hypothetical protein